MTALFSVFRFPIVNSSKNSTEYTSCFIFLFDILKTTKLMKKKNSKEAADFPGRFGTLTWRPGDLMKNLETPGKTGRVDRYGLCCHILNEKLQILLC